MIHVFDVLWYWYQVAMWYLSLTAGEYGKIGRFVNEFLLLMTFLTVRGIRITKKQAAIAYIAVVVIAVVVGIGIKNIGTVKIGNELNNKENPQMVEILERLKRIEEHQK